MSASDGTTAVRAALDPLVDSGHLPGYVAGWRREGETLICAGGQRAIEPSESMAEDTVFRIASLSKPVGAVIALTLVEEGRFGLDDEVARWLPELAEPRVLREIDAPLDDTVPAGRPIIVRDLLTMTAGFGLLGISPLQKAIVGADLAPGPFPPPVSHDEFMGRLAALPLALQPGEGWLYHTAADVLSVLVARVTGQALGEVLRERITEPLGMLDTAFHDASGRGATAYRPARDGGLQVLDPPDGAFSRPPAFEALGSGLVSTIPDYLAFLAMLADGGGPVLSPASVELIATDRLTEGQRTSAQVFLGADRSWGFMVEVLLEPAPESSLGTGSFGWMGGSGTTAYIDPGARLIGALFTQRAMETNRPTAYYNAFWQALYSDA